MTTFGEPFSCGFKIIQVLQSGDTLQWGGGFKFKTIILVFTV